MPHLWAKTPGTWILMFIWSQIKLFRHNLFLTTKQNNYFSKVSALDQLNTEMISENLNECSFGHEISHFITTCSWPPIKNFFCKSFSILSIKYEYVPRKIKQVFTTWNMEKESSNIKTDLKFGLVESFNQMKKSGYWCHTCDLKPQEHGF